MQLLLILGVVYVLSSPSAPTVPVKKDPTPPPQNQGGNWGTQLGAFFAGLGTGAGKVIDSFNNQD